MTPISKKLQSLLDTDLDAAERYLYRNAALVSKSQLEDMCFQFFPKHFEKIWDILRDYPVVRHNVNIETLFVVACNARNACDAEYIHRHLCSRVHEFPEICSLTPNDFRRPNADDFHISSLALLVNKEPDAMALSSQAAILHKLQRYFSKAQTLKILGDGPILSKDGYSESAIRFFIDQNQDLASIRRLFDLDTRTSEVFKHALLLIHTGAKKEDVLKGLDSSSVRQALRMDMIQTAQDLMSLLVPVAVRGRRL